MKRIKKWARNKLGLKIVSLILAIILWFYISGEIAGKYRAQKEVRLFSNIPVDIMGNLKNFGTSLRVTPEAVDLELGGPDVVLNNISRDDIKAYIEVGSLILGKYMLPLKVVLPAEIVLVSETRIIEVEVGVSEDIKD